MVPCGDATTHGEGTPSSEFGSNGLVYQDDPFQFDEQQLCYEGYDEETRERHTQWSTPLSTRHRISVVQQTRPYTLPIPPASSRRRPDCPDTPLKDYGGSFVTNSKRLHSPSSSSTEPCLNLRSYQLSSPTTRSSRNPVLEHQESQDDSTPTTSSFFDTGIAFNRPQNVFTNSSGMPVLGGIDLVSVHNLPDGLRSIFTYPAFNRMQSRCFKVAYGCDDNLVVSAPTASGKTTIFELAICRIITKGDITNIKMVYIGPTKALCEERYKDWRDRFWYLGITCSLLTGDSDHNQQDILRRSQIIVTTPEKWDSVTRKWHDKDKLMQLVRLLLIDEIHILNEERGATVEAIVTRMNSTERSIRLVALSATVPNATDVAAWLGKNSREKSTPAHLEVFGDEFRPCTLQKFVYSFKDRSYTHELQLDHHLNSELPTIIQRHSIGKPIMVFCSTRISAKYTAKYLAERWEKASQKLWPCPSKIPRVQDEDLKTMLKSGVAYHHAGICAEDRKNVEKAYLEGDLMIICCTSTLAVGVNLPCHLVIIKNTIKWFEGNTCEYSDLDIMQMLGRAGRPQFGDRGIGIILTQADKVAKYQSMAEGRELLESHLHLNLIEHLNAEITLGTIRSLQDAISWLASTFFFVRLQKNRQHYPIDDLPCGTNINQQLEHICATKISELRRHDMIEATAYRATEFGELMTRQYVRFKTMIDFKNMTHGADMPNILATLCSARELCDFKLDYCRPCSKSLKPKYRISIQDKHAEKVALIIQTILSGVAHPRDADFKCSYLQYRYNDSILFSRLDHLVSCLISCRRILRDGMSMGNVLELSRSIAARVWDNTPLIMMQLKGVGPAIVGKLTQIGIKTFEDLGTRPVEHLVRCVKSELFATKLLQSAKEIPALRLTASVQSLDKSNDYPNIHCRTEVGFFNDVIPETFNKRKVSMQLLIMRSDGNLIHYKHIRDINRPSEMIQHFSVRLEEYGQKIICQVSCDRIAGTLQQVVIEPNVPAHVFASCKKMENSRSQLRPKPTPQIIFPRLSEDDEFNDDDLQAEDFLTAELEDHRSNGRFQAIDEIAGTDHPQNFTISGPPSNTTSKLNVWPIAEPANTMPPRSLKSNNRSNPCQHFCKDKTSCKHSCCKVGKKRGSVKKNVASKRAPGNVEAKSKPKNSTLKATASLKSKFESHRVSKLPNKVTKPSTTDDHVTTGLDKIHNSAKGHTLPIALLSKKPDTINKPKNVSQSAVFHEFSDADEIYEDWFDDTMEPDLPNLLSRESIDRLSSPDTAEIQTREHGTRRIPHRKLLDLSSDSVLNDFQPQIPDHLGTAQGRGKRKASPSAHSPCKKACLENQLSNSYKTDIPPRISPTPVFTNQIGNSHDISDSPKAVETLSRTIENEVAQMSQEFASCQLNTDIYGTEEDFMAQYKDCCDFVG